MVYCWTYNSTLHRRVWHDYGGLVGDHSVFYFLLVIQAFLVRVYLSNSPFLVNYYLLEVSYHMVKLFYDIIESKLLYRSSSIEKY